MINCRFHRSFFVLLLLLFPFLSAPVFYMVKLVYKPMCGCGVNFKYELEPGTYARLRYGVSSRCDCEIRHVTKTSGLGPNVGFVERLLDIKVWTTFTRLNVNEVISLQWPARRNRSENIYIFYFVMDSPAGWDAWIAKRVPSLTSGNKFLSNSWAQQTDHSKSKCKRLENEYLLLIENERWPKQILSSVWKRNFCKR